MHRENRQAPVTRDPHRWVETTDGQRHAIARDSVFEIGDELTAFCTTTVTVDIGDVQHQGLFAECRSCNDIVHDLLGIPRPRPSTEDTTVEVTG